MRYIEKKQEPKEFAEWKKQENPSIWENLQNPVKSSKRFSEYILENVMLPTSISLKNYRSFAEIQHIDLRPITLFFGTGEGALSSL